MFTPPVAVGDAVAGVGVAPGDGGADPGADAEGAGEVAAAWADECEWVILGRMSQ